MQVLDENDSQQLNPQSSQASSNNIDEGSTRPKAGGGTNGEVIVCEKCGSVEYLLMDEKTGEVMCEYCRSRWIVPELVKKSETEKYLEQQAKRPKVTIDNTTETDKLLMRMLTGLFSGFNPLARLGDALKKFLMVVGVVVIVLIIVTLVFKYLVQIG